ncbi:MAG: hypothetical protein J6331_09870, partial [Lentisphaeria bacterium]|nr:hypothetical protein [Lentisphaeria bacterium]
DEKFRVWCVWAPDPGCGFIAAEPYTNFSGAFNALLPCGESFIPVLKGGQTSVFRSFFRILPAGTFPGF